MTLTAAVGMAVIPPLVIRSRISELRRVPALASKPNILAPCVEAYLIHRPAAQGRLVP